MYKDPAPGWAWRFQGIATEMKVVPKNQELSERPSNGSVRWSGDRGICLDFE